MKQIIFAISFLFFLGFLNAQEFYKGVDLSYVNELEDCGTVYYNESSVEQDPYTILSDKGANMVRLRLWHNPQWTSFSNFNDVKLAIIRAKAEGMAVMLDVHYSDFWADPSRQWRPEAWNDVVDDGILADSVFQYTYNTLLKLANENLLPEMVQIGNEINGNILIKRTTQDIDNGSPGMYPINWTRQVSLLQHGIDAVQQINTELSASVKTIIHIAQPENAVSWFDNATNNGLSDYDIIGLSYYPQWSDLGIREVGEHVKYFVDTYQKETMLVELGYPWTTSGNDNAGNVLGNGSKLDVYGNVLSKTVQKDFLIELSYLVKENGGNGVVYWEPAWVSSTCQTYWGTGSHYENAALFDFDNTLHEGAEFLSYNLSQKPQGLADKNVSFKVNMKGNSTDNGVFVTGDFTGDNWTFKEMTLSGENIYVFDTLLPGRSSGAYIFYNNNTWDNQFREVVPSSCAVWWDTHREYIILDADTEFHFAWERCTAEPPSGIVNVPDNEVRIYPTITRDEITIESKTEIQSLALFDISGKAQVIDLTPENKIKLDNLTPGLYYLVLKTNGSTHNFKIIRK